MKSRKRPKIRIKPELQNIVVALAEGGETITSIRNKTSLDWATIKKILIRHKVRTPAQILRIGHKATNEKKLKLSVQEMREMRRLLYVKDPAIALSIRQIAKLFGVIRDIPGGMNKKRRIRSRYEVTAIGKAAWRRNRPENMKGLYVETCIVAGMSDKEILTKLGKIDERLGKKVNIRSNKHLIYMHKQRGKAWKLAKRVKQKILGENPLAPDIECFENYVRYVSNMTNPEEQLAFAKGILSMKKIDRMNALTRLLDPEVNEAERKGWKEDILKRGK